MPGGESYERVSDHLQSLWDAYSGFVVTQTTVPVEDYDRAAERVAESVVEAGVRLLGEGDVQANDIGNEWDDPRGAVGPDETVEAAACRAFREATDGGCYVERLLRVDIVCLLDEATDESATADRPPIYRLALLFGGRRREGRPTGESAWRPSERASAGGF